MSKTLLIGKAKELYIATLLVAEGLHIYFPLVDNGFDLIVSNKSGTKFLPIQVKYKSSRTGFTLEKSDIEKFAKANAIIAFGSNEASLENFYFFPARHWRRKAKDTGRRDNKIAILLSEQEKWATQYKGKAGLDLCFEGIKIDV